MKYTQALSKLIDETHAKAVAHHIAIPGFESPETRDEVATSRANIRISSTVMDYLRQDVLYTREGELAGVEWDTFDNLREYGITVSVAGWTFTAYEHRNSDSVIVNGTRDEDVLPYGPYAPDGDKWDVLASFPWRAEYYAGVHLAELITAVRATPTISRDALKLFKTPEVAA